MASNIDGTIPVDATPVEAAEIRDNFAAAKSEIEALQTGQGNRVPTARLVSTSTGLSGGGDLSADRTLVLTDTAVAAGDYTNSNLTVDAQGRITAAASGAAGGAPEAHAASHAGGQFDELTPAAIGAEALGSAAAAVSVHDGDAGAHSGAITLANAALQPSDVGTAAAKDVPAAGDAGADECVLGDDTRLGGGGGGGHVIQDEGVGLTARANLNFIGSTVTAADDPGNDATTITVSAGAGSGDMDSEIYDPQTIVGDAFARSNHTGTQSADTITGLDKSSVGLGNVDNTSDVDKPVSTAQQTEIDTKEDSIGAKGTAFNKAFGTGAGDVCEGDDGRLADARAPTNNPKLIGYEEEVATHNDGAFDFTAANFFLCTPTGDITIAPVISALVVVSATIHVDNTAGATITMPAGTEWVGGSPTLGTKYAMTLYTMDGGTNWFAVHIGDLV